MGNCIIVQKNGSGGNSYTAGTGIDLTNNMITNTIMDGSVREKDGIDLNTIIEPGVYKVKGGSTALNFPSGNSAVLVVYYYDSTWLMQIYYRAGGSDTNASNVYQRYNYNGTWGVWVQHYNSLSLTGGTGIDIKNGVVTNIFQQLSGVDLNTVTYNYQGYAATNCTNKPTSTGGGFSAFFQHGASVIHGFQLFNQYTTDDLYFRRYNNGTWGTWTRVVTYYKTGETVTISNAPANDIFCNGFVTGSAKSIYFYLPLNKPVDASNVTFSSLYIVPRGDQGYMNGSSMVDVCADSNYTVTAKPAQGGIKILVEKTTAFTVTNNTPVALQVRGRTFTFS